MSPIRLYLVVLVTIFTLPINISSANQRQLIHIAVFKEQHQLINNIYNTYGCTDDAVANSPANQMIAELLLLCQALQLGNNNFRLAFVPFPVHKRIFQHLSRGTIAISGMGIWLSEAEKDNVYISSPLIKSGEFTKGIYHKKNSSITISKDKSKPFQGIRTVINTNWLMDYQALKCGGFDITHADRYESMFKMLRFDRVDVVAHAFTPHPQMHLTKEQETLVPVKGYRIVFSDSLHYFISKKHPLSKELYQAINIGLAKLRQKNIIEKTYLRVGIFRPETTNWTAINCNG